MTVKPGALDIEIIRGGKFDITITCRNKETQELINFTGKKARAQFRRTWQSPTKLASIDTETLGGITLGGAAGTIRMVIGASKTKLMLAAEGVWDIEIYTTEDDVDKYFKGNIIFDPEVTRE